MPRLAPALGRLVDAGLVIRHPQLRDRAQRTTWAERLTEVFDSQVHGLVFEQLGRTFVERFVADVTVPG